jgi:hypothetical protein
LVQGWNGNNLYRHRSATNEMNQKMAIRLFLHVFKFGFLFGSVHKIQGLRVKKIFLTENTTFEKFGFRGGL